MLKGVPIKYNYLSIVRRSLSDDQPDSRVTIVKVRVTDNKFLIFVLSKVTVN